MLIAGVVCGVLGILVGIPALRLRGIYLAIATIAFVEVLRVMSLNLEITGGAGISAFPTVPDTNPVFVDCYTLLVISMFFIYRLEKIRVGRAFAAIRER